jgi:hypothetical protein
MPQPGAHLQLFLDGHLVGTVQLQRRKDSWNFGQFSPNDAFSPYAPRFARWAMLMHEDEQLIVTRDLSSELREAENDLISIRAKLYLPDRDEWRKPAVLTIDGPLIEWKEF